MKKKFLTDDQIAWFIRFWSSGAVYFFIGWGTGLGQQVYMIDFILALGLALAIFEMFVVNPVIRLSLKTRKEALTYKRYIKLPLLRRVAQRILTIIKSTFFVVVVAGIYEVINQLAIIVLHLPENKVFLPGEPIIFGLLYTMVYVLFNQLVDRVNERIKGIKA